MPRPNPRYEVSSDLATNYLKNTNVDLYDFLESQNVKNPSAQQQSYLANLPDSLIPSNYMDLAEQRQLSSHLIQTLATLGISPSTLVSEAVRIINKFNNKMTEAVSLSVLQEKEVGETRYIPGSPLARVKEEIELLKPYKAGFEYKSIKEEWLNLTPTPDPSVSSSLSYNEFSEVADFVDFSLFPSAYAEPEPTTVYPQSANVRIIISNVSMFSTSIPINDVGQLQVLSNESNEWRYTLIGSSTNQPLMTLSGLINEINNQISSVVTPQPPIQPPTQPPTQPPIEEEPVTTDHIPPPDMPVEEPPMVTATEPGQVNWIPEPFFSFINNVFRK